MFSHIHRLFELRLDTCWMFTHEVRFMREAINGMHFEIGLNVIRITRDREHLNYTIEQFKRVDNKLESIDYVQLEDDATLVAYMPQLLNSGGVIC